MGSQQSKASPEVVVHERAVLERLRALRSETRDGESSDYVYVHGGALEKAAAVRQAEDLSVAQMHDWQKRLLEDPKNR